MDIMPSIGCFIGANSRAMAIAQNGFDTHEVRTGVPHGFELSAGRGAVTKRENILSAK